MLCCPNANFDKRRGTERQTHKVPTQASEAECGEEEREIVCHRRPLPGVACRPGCFSYICIHTYTHIHTYVRMYVYTYIHIYCVLELISNCIILDSRESGDVTPISRSIFRRVLALLTGVGVRVVASNSNSTGGQDAQTHLTSVYAPPTCSVCVCACVRVRVRVCVCVCVHTYR